MSHTHSFIEITAMGDPERHFRCSFCAAETAQPFPKVDTHTGVIEPHSPPITREMVDALRVLLRNFDGVDIESGEYVGDEIRPLAEALAANLEARLPPNA